MMNQFLKLEKLKTLFIDDDGVIRDIMQMLFTKTWVFVKNF